MSCFVCVCLSPVAGSWMLAPLTLGKLKNDMAIATLKSLRRV